MIDTLTIGFCRVSQAAAQTDIGLAPRFPTAVLTPSLCYAQDSASSRSEMASGCDDSAVLMASMWCADRGQKRSRPPSPSRLEAVENGRDRDRPRPAAADKAKPAAEGRQGGQRFAVNLLPEKGAAPRGAEGEQPRDNEARKRSRSPPPAADAEALAGKVAPRSLELGISPPPPGLSPEGSIAPLPAAAGKAANGNVAAEAGRGDHRDRGTGLPAAGVSRANLASDMLPKSRSCRLRPTWPYD